ncbi:UNVERIFIED_ORG: peptidase S8 [Lacrimispora saccharolytica]
MMRKRNNMRKVNSREQRRELFRAPTVSGALLSAVLLPAAVLSAAALLQAGYSALPAPVRSSLTETQEKEGAVRAFAAGPGTQAYPGGDPYNEYQWGFLNNGLFRLTDKNSGAGAAFQNLTSRTGGPAYGPEVDSRGTTFAKAGMDINLTPARAAYDAVEGKTETVVAVIDTGIQTDHEELSGGIWTNADETPGDGTDNDGNGYVDDVNGWNFYAGNNQLYSGREDNHGTHSAGTIAAAKNGRGITGICDPAYVKIMPIKVLGTEEGIGTPEHVAQAIRYAEANGASICNLSFGTARFNQELYDTMKNSGMLFVVAAGNGDRSGNGINIDESPVYPAAFDLDNVISVASMRLDGNLDPSSNYGPAGVDLAAPGKYILSTISGNQYAYMSGTSMAAPMVTGVAAMIKSAYPDTDTGRLRQLILSSVKENSAMDGKTATGGMLDAGKAMELAGGA